MNGYLSGVATVLSLELRQRVRGTAWYVLLGIFVALVALVTLLLGLSLSALGAAGGGGIYSSIIFFILLLGTLITPALSGSAINGDRDAGTLATTQVTLITTGQLVLGKFLAAWISALAFLVASLPFLVLAVALGGVRADTIVTSTAVLAAELAVFSAIGVGLSGLLTRPVFSIVVSYLAVAALSIGTLIAFTLGGLTVQSRVTYSYVGIQYTDAPGTTPGAPGTGPGLTGTITCLPEQITVSRQPRFDYFWGFLAANPYVVLADSTPITFDSSGNPQDLFGFLKVGVRQAQLPPESTVRTDECAAAKAGFPPTPSQSAREIIARTVPGWFVGLAIHLLLAAAALLGGWAATRTPAARLAKGSRIA